MRLSPLEKQAVVLWLAFAALRLLWPGDAPFVHDEGMLLQRAFADNARGVWTTHGLEGSRGIVYGPVPILLYRAYWAVCSSILALVVLKAFLITLATGISVSILWRQFPAIPLICWFLPILSAYQFFYARDLWDNSLNIAFSGWLFAGYALFLQRRLRIVFLSLVLAAVCALQVHVKALPLVVAVAAHLVSFHMAWLRRYAGFVVGTLAVAAVSFVPYVWHLMSAPRPPSEFGFRLASVFFTFAGVRLWTAYGLEYFVGPEWFLQGPGLFAAVGTLAVAVTIFAAIPTVVGMAQAFRHWGMRASAPLPALDWVACTALALHGVLVTVNRLVSHPAYFNSIWIVFLWFYARGAQALWTRGWARRMVAISVAGLGWSLLWFVWNIHENEGTRSLRYGTTLRNSLELAAVWKCYPKDIPVDDQRSHSHLLALDALKLLVDCPGPVAPARELKLKYAPSAGKTGARAEWVPVK